MSMTGTAPPRALLDWWCDDLPEDEARAVEERLFADDGWAAALERIAAFAGRFPAAFQAGGAGVVGVTAATVERLAAEGVPVRRDRVEPGVPCPCAVGGDSLHLVHLRLGAAIPEGRLDVRLHAPAAGIDARAEDVAVDRAAGEIVLAYPAGMIRTFPDGTVTLTVIAVDAAGERVLADYMLEHRAGQGG